MRCARFALGAASPMRPPFHLNLSLRDLAAHYASTGCLRFTCGRWSSVTLWRLYCEVRR